VIENKQDNPQGESKHSQWTLDAFTTGVDQLASFPEAVIKVNELLSDGKSDAGDIAAVLETDPAFNAKLLQIANSAMFGARTSVDSTRKAVTLMGAVPVRNLCFSIAARGVFADVTNSIVTQTDFWSHSVYCAATARALASICVGKYDAEAAFTAGILHDIGHLVMFHQAPEVCEEILLETLSRPNIDLAETERRRFGFDHGEVGVNLLSSWDLPENLQECVAFHHQPVRATKYRPLVELVHAANVIANYVQLNDFDTEFTDVEESVVSNLGLKDIDIQHLLESVDESVGTVPSFLVG